MRVAAVHNLPSGGAKRALHGLLRSLAGDGVEVEAYVPSTADETYCPLGEFARRVTVVPVRRTLGGVVRSTIRYLPPVGPLPVSLADLEQAHRTLARLVDDGGHDVVVVEQDRFTTSPFVLRFLRTPHVYFCQQPSRLDEMATRPARERLAARTRRLAPLERAAWRWAAGRLVQLDRDNARFATTVLANSYFSRETILRAYGLDARVSYLGVDPVFSPAGTAREGFVLSVGFLGPWKGHDFLVGALGRLPPSVRPRLVIVGNGADEGWRLHLERAAERLGVELDLRPALPDAELVKLYRTARLFVYAPHLEPFGLTPLEAMACATPVVAVREGGVRETVVDGQTGILTDRDERAFAEAIGELLGDDGRRRRLGEAGVGAVQGFWTLAHAADRFRSHLERARAGA